MSLAKRLDGWRYRLGQGPSWVAQRTMVSVLWYLSQARTQEMKWGVVFVKKYTFPPHNETKLMLDLFFILHFTYLGVRTHPGLQC